MLLYLCYPHHRICPPHCRWGEGISGDRNYKQLGRSKGSGDLWPATRARSEVAAKDVFSLPSALKSYIQQESLQLLLLQYKINKYALHSSS